MIDFPSHTLDSAPEVTRPMLEGVQQRFGFIPDIYAKMAEAPAALESYLAMSEIFSRSSLTPQQQQVVLLAVSIENRCEYCVAAHTMVATKMAQVDADVVESLRNGHNSADKKLQALADFTRVVVRERGFIPQVALEQFLAAGYLRSQILEVILGVSIETLSNYSNHNTYPKIDPAFQNDSWQAPIRPM
ncbi:MAG: carboxymuconolactone decarboxylase family protein [Motiliproteus sp.]